MAKVSISETTRVPRKKYVASNKVDDLRLYQVHVHLNIVW